MKQFRTGIILALVLGVVAGQADIEDGLKNCLGRGTALDDCLKELAENLRPYMSQGLPKYNIPPTDPMYLDEITLRLKRPPVDVTVEFTDTVINGLSGFRLNDVHADKAAQTIELDMTVPRMTNMGQYKMSGRAFVVIKDSEGPFKVDIKDLNVLMTTKLKVQNGRLLVDGEPDVKVKVGDLKVKLENLFGGKTPQLAATITQFLNNDSDRFIEDFGPQITSQVSRLAVKVYNTAVQDIDPKVFGIFTN